MNCAVRSCRNDPHRRPDLNFFSLPNHQDVREEWLDILGIGRVDYLKKIKVCELHFKPKDFGGEGRKQLKSHAVPVLKLGTGKSDAINSDDEFMEYQSDSDQEIVELSNSKLISGKMKQQEIPIKQESSEEPSEGRRPSRRAAREAAKKIYNTVRNFMPNAGAGDDDVYTPPSGSPSITLSKFNNVVGRPKKRSSIKVEIDLVMECHEEILSPVQAEALLKSQLEYNMVMKTLRTLKASNAKIIFSKEPYSGTPPAPATSVTNASVVPLKLANNPAIQITKTTLPA